MTKKHIALKGAKAGQFVSCTAKVCRNGGMHVEHKLLTTVQIWKSETAGSRVNQRDLSEQDVKDFNQLSADEKKNWAVKAGTDQRVRNENRVIPDKKKVPTTSANKKPLYTKEESAEYNQVIDSALDLLVLDRQKGDLPSAISKFNNTFDKAKRLSFGDDWKNHINETALNTSLLGAIAKANTVNLLVSAKLDVQRQLPAGTTWGIIEKEREASKKEKEDSMVEQETEKFIPSNKESISSMNTDKKDSKSGFKKWAKDFFNK
jgi:hypothetical protein